MDLTKLTDKIVLLAQLKKNIEKTKEWVASAINKAIGDLKLTNITDVTASATEVNHLKGVESNVQQQINDKAPLNSPEFSGTPTAPTAVAGTNTQQIATTAFVKDAVETVKNEVKADLGSALTYKGSVADYDSLPKEGQSKGDTYNVVAAHGNTPAGTNYAWDGEKWDPLGGDIDLTPLLTKVEAQASYQPKGDYLTENDIQIASDTDIESAWAEE